MAKRVYNNIGCELINYSGCEKGHGGYPNWSCADAEAPEQTKSIEYKIKKG